MHPFAQVTPPATPPPDIIEERVLDTPVEQACGVEDPGPFCTWVYEQTGNGVLSRLAGEVIPGALRIAIVVLVALLITRLVRRLVRRLVLEVRDDALSRLRGFQPVGATGEARSSRAQLRLETIAGVFTSVASGVVWAIAVLMILSVFHINLGPLIAGAGIIGIALGFGAQSLVRDFLTGGFMLLEDQYGVGDIVDVGEATGVVEAITLRTTRLRDVQGTVWHVPNGEIRRVGNLSQQWARSLIDVGVAYDTDLEHAQRVIKRVADELWKDPEWGERVLDEPEVWGVEAFGESEITIRVVLKVEPARQWAVNRQLRQRLKAAFDAEGISIPFPQRTLWVRQADGQTDDVLR